ncbi:MAG: hypothetical protein NWT00_06130, partial [Beijerinckiaceae bacterium]|nr:hypothetical protein [Beijerinckiaceae bacterium]
IRNRSASTQITRLVFGVMSLAAVAGIVGSLMFQGVPAAKAAPAVDAAAPLTISRKPPTDLSAAPGIRLAKISSQDGSTCFRASRSLPRSGRTISETFCTH